MAKLREKLNDVAESLESEEGVGIDPIETLKDAASEWAEHCLRTYRGDLLRTALDISVAIATFSADLEKP